MDKDFNAKILDLHDVERIDFMLIRAKEFSLESEVVWAFGNARTNGLDVPEAIEAALNMWDI
jgi:hypothetical protein